MFDPMYGILTGKGIEACVEARFIVIDPFNPAQMNPASYDLTLGDEVRVYDDWVSIDYNNRADGSSIMQRRELDRRIIDIRQEPKTTAFKIGPEGWVIKPGVGYLMHTHERVHTNRFVPVLDGKSSIGRLFVQVHATAGYGDPGFNGQYTLEVTATHAVRVFAGMRFAQIRFHTVRGRPEEEGLYAGSYQGEASLGAVASRAWKQFSTKRFARRRDGSIAYELAPNDVQMGHCADGEPLTAGKDEPAEDWK